MSVTAKIMTRTGWSKLKGDSSGYHAFTVFRPFDCIMRSIIAFDWLSKNAYHASKI